MDSKFFKIQDTNIDGKSLNSSLLSTDVQSLLYKAFLKRNPPIVVFGSDEKTRIKSLTADDYFQALINSQSVNGSGLLGDTTLRVGEDLPSVAASYIQLFSLTSGSFNKILLRFGVDEKALGNTAIFIGNDTGTNFNVQFKQPGGGISDSALLFPEFTSAGVIKTVEVWAENTSPGSEIVVFNSVA